MKFSFNLEIEGRDAGHSASMSVTNSPLAREFTAYKNGFRHAGLGLFVWEEGQALCLENRSKKSITVRHFSRLFQFPLGGADCSCVRLHWLDSSWEAEFQYRSATLRELDVYPVSTHPVARSFSLLSHGTYTTCTHLPFLAAENSARGETLWCSAAPSGSWRIEAGLRGENVYLDVAEIDARHCGTAVTLAPGERYTGMPVAGGIVRGGFGSACRAHCAHLRAAAGERSSPVVFNDYMNCLWARPSEEKLIPLIEAAAKAGAEVFCIDDGWYFEKDAAREGGMGDWAYSHTLFGERGFRGIIDFIRSKGMRAGIWLEMEVCGEKSALYRRQDDWFLCRNGVRIGGGDRVFLNFENPDVRAYLRGIVKQYYDMGVRYIKNDYNACVDGGYEVTAHARAVRAFYRSLKAEFPDLMLENCASGGMRCDEGMLAFCDTQSTSDQEIAAYYPSIAVGALAYMPPELAGIWAYPYPHTFVQFFTGVPFRAEGFSAESVVFNLVTGLAGTPCLSGRLDGMGEEALGLVAEAVALHKRLRAFKSRAYAYFPLGFARIGDEEGPQALLLADGSEGLLYVWRRRGSERIVLPLRLEGAELLYPSKDFPQRIEYSENGTEIFLPQTDCARMYRVTLRGEAEEWNV